MKDFWRLIKFLNPYKARLFFALVNMVLVAVFTALLTWVVKSLMDDVLINSNSKALFAVCLMILFFYFGKGVSSYFSSYMMESIGLRIIRDLRFVMFNHLINQSISHIQNYKAGHLQSRVISDTEKIKLAVSQTVGDLLKEGLTLLGLLIYIFWLDWKLAFASSILLPLVIYPIIRLGEKLRKVSSTGQENIAELTHLLGEMVYATRIIKAFCMENFQLKKFKKILNKVLLANLHASRIVSLSTPLMEFIGGIGAILVLIYANYQIRIGYSTPGKITSFLTALFFMYAPIKKLSRVNNVIQEASAASSRVFEILDEDIRINEDPYPLPLRKIREKIEFRNVSFRYNSNDILRNINLEVKVGQKVAIIGSSGVGKSTLVNLIPRLYDPTEGQILIDGIDIQKISLKDLRNKIGIVTQETILFNDTIKNNIAYGLEDVDEDMIIRAAKAAYAHDFIMELQNGYDTVLGDWGQSLSTGQKQRIAIARAILKNPEILILDEATAALDAESIAYIQEALENLLKNRTAFIITHHLASLSNIDFIVVLDEGTIKAIGNHEYLLRNEPLYSRLYELQMLD